MSHPEPAPPATLLERSSPTGCGTAAASDVLDRSEEVDLLVVSYRDGPNAWLGALRSRLGDLPPEIGFVHAGVTVRSATTAAPTGAISLPETASRPETTPIPDPTDLGRVGVRASEYLEAWAGNDRRTVVVLDSVTAMLAEVTLQRVFSFLDLFAGRIESVDARGYYLVDPTAHADHVLNVLRDLPESVVGVEDSPAAPEA